MPQTIFLFGEAEKGEFCTPLACESLSQLAERFGSPPGVSQGIFYAIQTLLFERALIFYRVKEEGYSLPDYMRGIKLLRKKELSLSLTAICMPGVGNDEIIDATQLICQKYNTLLILTPHDLYDYLTAGKG